MSVLAAFGNVLRAAALLPVGGARSLTCKLAGHRPHPEWPTVCDRCGTNL